MPQGFAQLVGQGEGLRHLPQKALGQADRRVRGQVEVGGQHVLGDPLGQLRAFVQAIVALVSKYHEAVVLLASDDPAHTLGGGAHGIECQKLGLFDLVVVPQELEPSTQDSALCVHVGNTEQQHCPATPQSLNTKRKLLVKFFSAGTYETLNGEKRRD